jgi:intron-binding protein aquarius
MNIVLDAADVLLSLVRTKAVGHLRDVRRLIVAMSRARLGLYVFCRRYAVEP